MSSDRAEKVAIVGGGCAAIAAAFELSRPELQGRFDVTIYQLGWRLGGKGASGRGLSGRIEEHGLHVWLGFYENAFRLLRECYAELAADPGDFQVHDWRAAFIAEETVGLSSQSQRGDWYNWSAWFPPRDGAPGDPVSAAEPLSARSYVSGALAMLAALIESVDSRTGTSVHGSDQATADPAAVVEANPGLLASTIRNYLAGAASVSAAVLVEGLALLQAGLEILTPATPKVVLHLAESIAENLRQWLERSLSTEPYFQHVWEVMDVVVASLVGIVRHRLLTDPRGFDAIDGYDWREWLRLNGASERALQSAFLLGNYDLAMAYEDGDPARPSLSAAVALRATLRMYFTYRGALYWRMRAGMGDTVFAPYYEALHRRGVKFEFFHRLTNVRLSHQMDPSDAEGPFVVALEFDVQATVKGGVEYSPLVRVKGRPCWPSQPDFSQLEDGERAAREGRDFESHWDRGRVARKILEVQKDFDFVVLGVSLGEIPNVCADVLARDARWREMVENVRTIETQAFQIWTDADLGALGWTGPNFIGSAFAKPFDTWCDMAHTIPEEDWDQAPRAVLYFCGPLAGPAASPETEARDYPAQRQADVLHNALNHLQSSVRVLWPAAYDAEGEFRWDLLRDAKPDYPANCESVASPLRFETQYWRANVNPSDRYVLAVPDGAKHRISPLDMTYDNMTIAGDWTACGLNQGCVEAAVISGRLAAHALSGLPALGDIVGYDHP